MSLVKIIRRVFNFLSSNSRITFKSSNKNENFNIHSTYISNIAISEKLINVFYYTILTGRTSMSFNSFSQSSDLPLGPLSFKDLLCTDKLTYKWFLIKLNRCYEMNSFLSYLHWHPFQSFTKMDTWLLYCYWSFEESHEYT